MSTILPTPLRAVSLPAVGFWASLAVADAVALACDVSLALKWPNDLLLGGRKCAGILSEARSAGGRSRVVVGLGLNVNRPLTADRSFDAAWLSDGARRSVDREALCAALLGFYEKRFDELADRPDAIIARWNKRAALHGQRMAVKDIGGRLLCEGTAQGVDPSDGALLLQTDGGLQRVTLGDVEALG